MADKARPCPCTNPELSQFKWVSTSYSIAGRVKRLLLYATFILRSLYGFMLRKYRYIYNVDAVVV